MALLPFASAPFSLAIGSAISSGTSGSVLYIDSSGTLAQDNSNFFWDATNHRLGIGTTGPVGGKLDVNGGMRVRGAWTNVGDGIAVTGIGAGTITSITGGVSYSALTLTAANFAFAIGATTYARLNATGTLDLETDGTSANYLRISQSGNLTTTFLGTNGSGTYSVVFTSNNTVGRALGIGCSSTPAFSTSSGGGFQWSSGTVGVNGNDTGIGRVSGGGGVQICSGAGFTALGFLTVGTSDAGTTTTPTGLIVGHRTSGTAAAGFGITQQFQLDSTTTVNQAAANIVASWATATHASRKGQMVLQVVDNSATREGLRLETDGTYALSAFGGQGGSNGIQATTAATFYAPAATYTAVQFRSSADGLQSANTWEGRRGSDGALLAYMDPLFTLVSSQGLYAGRPPTDAGYTRMVSNEIDYYFGTPGAQTRRMVFGYDSNQLRGIFYSDLGGVGVFFFDSGTLAAGALPNNSNRNNVEINPTSAPYTRLISYDALTNTTVRVGAIRHTSSGTPAAGFGSEFVWQLDSSTTVNQDAFSMISTWVVATHATRTARTVFNAYDTAARECLRMEASGSAPMLGFLGASAVAQQSGDVATALVNYGLLTSPTYGTHGRSTAQTAAVASVATTTVGAADGSFLISANILISTSTLHSFSCTCTYTDEGNTSRTLTLNFSQLTGAFVTTLTNALGASAYEGVPVHIRAKSGTAITLATTGTFTTVTYNVEGHITQIA